MTQRERDAPHLSVVGAPICVVDLEPFRRWLVGQSMAPATIHSRVTFARRWFLDWGTAEVSPYQAATWLSRHTGWTRRTYLAHIKSIYEWLVEIGEVDESPVKRYRLPPEPRPQACPVTNTEMELLLDAATGDLHTWLALGFFAGLRVHEIAKMRGELITVDQLRVLGKGGSVFYLPTHPRLWTIAQEYPRDGWWFPSIQAKRDYISEGQISSKVRAHFRAHGVDQGSTHRCRHTYATNLARAGVQPRVVQDLMRHRDLNTTMRYLAVNDEERQRAIRLLG